MTLRTWKSAFLAISITGTGIGCGQADTVAGPPVGDQTSVEEALKAAKDCQAQARTCESDALVASCDEQLRECLSSTTGAALVGKRGDAATRREDDDAAVKPQADHDGGVGKPEKDGGRAPIEAVDGAATGHPKPAAPDGGLSVASCVDELHACLDTSARPPTCAATLVSCLSTVRVERK